MSAQWSPMQRGAELKRLRGASRQRDVADALGVSTQAVSLWENGGTPELHHIQALDDHYGADGKVLQMFGIRASAARRDEITRLRAVVRSQGQAILALAAEMAKLPGVEPLPPDVLERIRAAQRAG